MYLVSLVSFLQEECFSILRKMKFFEVIATLILLVNIDNLEGSPPYFKEIQNAELETPVLPKERTLIGSCVCSSCTPECSGMQYCMKAFLGFGSILNFPCPSEGQVYCLIGSIAQCPEICSTTATGTLYPTVTITDSENPSTSYNCKETDTVTVTASTSTSTISQCVATVPLNIKATNWITSNSCTDSTTITSVTTAVTTRPTTIVTSTSITTVFIEDTVSKYLTTSGSGTVGADGCITSSTVVLCTSAPHRDAPYQSEILRIGQLAPSKPHSVVHGTKIPGFGNYRKEESIPELESSE